MCHVKTDRCWVPIGGTLANCLDPLKRFVLRKTLGQHFFPHFSEVYGRLEPAALKHRSAARPHFSYIRVAEPI
jgi:hypothetical protein